MRTLVEPERNGGNRPSRARREHFWNRLAFRTFWWQSVHTLQTARGTFRINKVWKLDWDSTALYLLKVTPSEEKKTKQNRTKRSS